MSHGTFKLHQIAASGAEDFDFFLFEEKLVEFICKTHTNYMGKMVFTQFVCDILAQFTNSTTG